MNKMSRRIGISTALAACVVLALTLSLRVRAADADKSDHGGKHLSNADELFIKNAGNGGLMEVALGKVAQTNANSEAVKKFGARMVEDHTKANEQLTQLAQAKGVKIDPEFHGAHKEAYDRLAAFKGEKFDREYMTHMVKDHQEDISAFEKEAKNGNDAQVREWAEQTLPTLREHLKLAKEVAPQVGAKAGDHSDHGDHNDHKDGKDSNKTK